MKKNSKSVIRTNNPNSVTPSRELIGASVSMAVRLVTIPALIKELHKLNPAFLPAFLELDDLIAHDNVGAFAYSKVLGISERMLQFCPVERKEELLLALKTQMTSHKIQKQTNQKFGNSTYIERKPISKGSHTEQSRIVKALPELVEVKLNMLNEYDRWLEAELATLKAGQTMLDQNVSNSEFMRVYNLEVTPQRTKGLLDKLNLIDNNLDKLTFLINEKSNYLNNLSAEVINSSGVVDYPNIAKGTPLFFDRIIQNEIDRIKQLEAVQNTKSQKKAGLTQTVNSSNLSDFFADQNLYVIVMQLLVDNDYCQAETYVWKDENNGSRGALVSLIKHLHKLKYYKGDICPSNKQIVAIASNTFGIKMGVDIAKKNKANGQKYSFIPVATNLTQPND